MKLVYHCRAAIVFAILLTSSLATTSAPSLAPSSEPSEYPSNSPTQGPSLSPVRTISSAPSSEPSEYPSNSPTQGPSLSPVRTISSAPSSEPSECPSNSPTQGPSLSPVRTISSVPSSEPSEYPSNSPTQGPFSLPSAALTPYPTASTSSTPTLQPTESSRSYVVFYTAQDLTGVSYVEFVNDHMSSITFRSAVAEFVSYVSPERVAITSAEEKLLRVFSSNDVTTVYYDTRVPLSSWTYSNSRDAYDTATEEITASVSSNNFTSLLRRYSSVLGSTSLLEAEASLSGLRISLDYDVITPSTAPTPATPHSETFAPSKVYYLSGSNTSPDKWYSPVFVPVILTVSVLIAFILFVGSSRAWKRWNVYGEGSMRYTRQLHHEPVMFSLGDEEDMLGNTGGMFSRRRSSLSSSNSDVSTKSPQLDDDALVL